MRVTIGLVFAALAYTPLHAQDDTAVDPLQTRTLDAYSALEGNWEMDPTGLSADIQSMREEQGISRNWVSFSFGTDRQWIEFGDWREQKGIFRKTGAGLIAFSPREQQVIFTEHGARGAAVHGTLKKADDGSFVRDISVSRTDTAWRQVDRWVMADNGRCFSWTTEFFRNGEGLQDSTSRYCRSE